MLPTAGLLRSAQAAPLARSVAQSMIVWKHRSTTAPMRSTEIRSSSRVAMGPSVRSSTSGLRRPPGSLRAAHWRADSPRTARPGMRARAAACAAGAAGGGRGWQAGRADRLAKAVDVHGHPRPCGHSRCGSVPHAPSRAQSRYDEDA